MPTKSIFNNRITDVNFFLVDAITLAQKLLGMILVRRINGKTIKAKIVETEAYMGAVDSASHSYRMRRTKRVLPMYEIGGHCYVYFTYGMHYCFNIVANEKEIPEAVLIRAVEIISGFAIVKAHLKPTTINKPPILWANGPAKLCQALAINWKQNQLNLLDNPDFFLENDSSHDPNHPIVCAKRINIETAIQDKDKLWRFYLANNLAVSKLKRSD